MAEPNSVSEQEDVPSPRVSTPARAGPAPGRSGMTPMLSEEDTVFQLVLKTFT